MAVFTVMVLGATLLLFSGCQKESTGPKAGTPPSPVVEVVSVIQKDVPIFTEWVGTLDGFVNATIRAQVQGYLIKQNYREGDFVRQGQVLFEIDPREFQAALEQANAVLTQSRGALDQTQAALEKAKAEVSVQDARWTTAKANLARIKPLADQNAVSKKDLDDAVGMELSTRSAVDAAKAGVSVAEANIAAAKAQVLGAQAAVDRAQLNLSFTKIISPINGIAGIAKAQIGNLVGPGSVEELTTISTVDPIKCYISLSEQEYMRAAERHRDPQKVPLELILADGSIHPYKGEFFLADRQVDVKTGTFRIGALFKNPRNILRPGQFARVRAEVKTKKGALLVPQRAVTELQGSYQVAVVGPDRKVDIRPVKTGERVQNLWVIDEGLKPGEQVVSEGVQKVRQGMTVTPKPAAVPGKPEDSGKPGAQPGAAAKTEKG